MVSSQLVTMSLSDLVARLQEIKPHVANRYNIRLIALFGSYAKELAHSDSDLDVLYEVIEGKRFGLLEVSGAEEYMTEVMGVPAVDLVDRAYLNPVIGIDIENDLVYV